MGGKQSTNNDLKGRVAVIISIENELCFRTAFDLIERGAYLIVGCKNPEKLIKKMSKSVRKGKVDLLALDLICNSSILEFANHVKSRHDKIHIMMSSVEIIEHAQGLSYLYKLLFDTVKNSGKLGQVCAQVLKTFSETIETRSSRKRNLDWQNSFSYSKIILVSSVRLKHLRGIEYWKFRHEESSRPKGLGDQRKSIPNIEVINNIGEISHCLEEENCHIILAALNPSTIRTERYNRIISGRNLLKWSWYNLGRNTSNIGNQGVLYVAIGTIDKNERSKSKDTCFSCFWFILYWLKVRFNK